MTMRIQRWITCNEGKPEFFHGSLVVLPDWSVYNTRAYLVKLFLPHPVHRRDQIAMTQIDFFLVRFCWYPLSEYGERLLV